MISVEQAKAKAQEIKQKNLAEREAKNAKVKEEFIQHYNEAFPLALSKNESFVDVTFVTKNDVESFDNLYVMKMLEVNKHYLARMYREKAKYPEDGVELHVIVCFSEDDYSNFTYELANGSVKRQRISPYHKW